MTEMIAKHPIGEKAAAGGGQDGRQTRYQAVNGASTANDPVALPTAVGDVQQRFLEVPGKGSESFSLKTELVPELKSKIHAQVSGKTSKRKKAAAAGQICQSKHSEAHHSEGPPSPPALG